MAASRWDPFRDLLAIEDEMNRLFGRTYGGSGVEPGDAAPQAADVVSPDRRGASQS